MLAAHQLINGFHASADPQTRVHHPSSSHPSPTESDPKGSTGHTDSNSESSQASPGSGVFSGDDFPQDLSVPKRPTDQAAIKTEPQSQANQHDDGLSSKCPHCDRIFASPQMLQLHIQESHLAQPIKFEEGLPRPHDDAAASLLGLQVPLSGGHDVDSLLNKTPNGAPKVFNPEAFCDICQKEFCNKYYLQTHKATKHGIPALSGISLASNLGMAGFELGDPSTTISGPSVDVRCPLCAQGPFANQLQLQSHVMMVHNRPALQPPSVPSPFGPSASALQAYYAALAQAPQLMGQFGGVSLPTVSAVPVSSQNILESLGMVQGLHGLLAPSPYGPPPSTGTPSLEQALAARMGVAPPQLPPSMTNPSIMSTLAPNHLIETNNVLRAETNPAVNQNTASTPSMLQGQINAYPGGSPTGNAESYCDICRKEFCNKYFLRTHKLKKHGIVNDETTSSGKKRTSFSESPSKTDSLLQAPDEEQQAIQVSSPAKQASPVLAEALQKTPSYVCPEPQQPYPSVIVNGAQAARASPEPKVQKLDPVPTAPPQRMSQLDQMMAAASAATAIGTGGTLACNLCARSFPSMFSLVAHKYRDHAGAGLDGGIPTSVLTTTATTPQKASTEQMTPPREQQSPVLQAVDPEAYCDLCKKEFCSKYFLKTHRLNIHGIMDPNGSPGGTPSMVGSPSVPQLNSLALSPSSAPAAPRQRPRYVTGKNFCDICNKEVCNKYFLRTHMLKMHGIVIDENKTVIGNINTVDKEKMGGLIFRCDLCYKELSSRSSLRQHKQTIHGMNTSMSESTASMDCSLPTMVSAQSTSILPPPNVTVSQNGLMPATGKDTALKPTDENDLSSRYFSHYTEVCPVCDRRFKSVTWLQNHMQSEHAGEVPQELLESFQKSAQGLKEEIDRQNAELQEQQQLLNGHLERSSTVTCEYCGLGFDDAVSLQLHVIGQHASEVQNRASSLAEQTALDSMPLPETPAHQTAEPNGEFKASPPLVMKHNGTKLYRCSYCHYYTRWLSNLSVHERRHTGGTPREEKPFVCTVCLRAYRYAHSLERHKTVHRFMGLAHKPWASPEKSPLKKATGDLNAEENGPSHSSQAAAGAKRYRCTKCQKVFKSRELCRSHLFAVHRRQELHAMMSPSKLSNEQRALMTSPLDLANQPPDPSVSQVVEELHQMSCNGIANNKNESETDLAICEENVQKSDLTPNGFGIPYGGDASNPRPYVLQPFLMRQMCENGKRVAALMPETMVYLPVAKRILEPVETTLQLVPLDDINSEIKTL